MATPLYVMAFTASEAVLVSSIARPTMRTLFVPVPTVCDQLTAAAFVAEVPAAASKAMAADVRVDRRQSAAIRETNANAKRARQRSSRAAVMGVGRSPGCARHRGTAAGERPGKLGHVS